MKYLWRAFSFLFPYVAAILIAGISSCILNSQLLSINSAYQSDNLPISTQTAEEGSSTLDPLSYRLYLDVSPSMWGFSEGNGVMPSVAQAMRTVSSSIGSSRFSYFRFLSQVEITTETDFIKLMQDSNGIESRFINEQFLEEEGQSLSDAIDPNLIFSDSYGGGEGFNVDNNTVNIIITDLNFLKNAEDKDGHTELLERFTGNIVTYGADGNISIYCISSPHTGLWTDAYAPNSAFSSSSPNSSFFIIILSRSTTATYDRFIQQWEQALMSAGIYTGSKHVLKNDPAAGLEPLTLDRTVIRTDSVRNSLNWDNQIFRNLPENAVGLRVFKEDGEDDSQLAMLQLPVAQITLPGYASGMEDGITLEGITTYVKLSQRTLLGWEEYDEISPIRSENAALVSRNGQWNLSYEMYLDKNAGVPGILHKCLLADIRFHLTEVHYSVPEWVQTAYDERLSSLELETELVSFFERVNSAKEMYYQNMSDLERGYLGNLLLYINY